LRCAIALPQVSPLASQVARETMPMRVLGSQLGGGAAQVRAVASGAPHAGPAQLGVKVVNTMSMPLPGAHVDGASAQACVCGTSWQPSAARHIAA
jgi:hypothetical protein